MKRLTVTLRLSYAPDEQDIEDAGGWDNLLAEEAAFWCKTPNLALESVTPENEIINPFEFQIEEIRVEEASA